MAAPSVCRHQPSGPKRSSSFTSDRSGQCPGCVCGGRGQAWLPSGPHFPGEPAEAQGGEQLSQAGCGPASVSSSTEGWLPSWAINPARGTMFFGAVVLGPMVHRGRAGA